MKAGRLILVVLGAVLSVFLAKHLAAPAPVAPPPSQPAPKTPDPPPKPDRGRR